MNTFRGLFGAIIVRERGAKRPDVEQVLFLHSLLPPDDRAPARVPVHQRARVRRQHADHHARASARTSPST